MDTPHSSKEPSPAEKFRAFAQKVVSVPKTEIDRREAEVKKERDLRRQKEK